MLIGTMEEVSAHWRHRINITAKASTDSPAAILFSIFDDSFDSATKRADSLVKTLEARPDLIAMIPDVGFTKQVFIPKLFEVLAHAA